MRSKPYYSVRTGKHPQGGKFDRDTLKTLFLKMFEDMERECYFEQAFGKLCEDRGRIPGTAGADINSLFMRRLKKSALWPIDGISVLHYTEADLFDVIELLFDIVSKPVSGYFHDYNGCGWHYDTFDPKDGQAHYRSLINELLADYGPGYVLGADGEIHTLPPTGLGDLEQAPIPRTAALAVDDKVAQAVAKFRRRGATPDERRDALRDLADVLEYLRPQAKAALHSADEADLFNIANNFGLRHHNAKQKTDYDRPIFYSWLFYYYLSSIHALTRLIARPPAQRKL